MPMDGLMLAFVAKELAKELIGARVDKIMQPSRDSIVIALRNNSKNYRLNISANASYARVHFTDEKLENPTEPPMMCMLMRKHLYGARLKNLYQFDFDRIIHIVFEGMNELGDIVDKKIIIEIMGKHSNIILVNENNKIIDSIFHVNHEMSRVRLVQPGMDYQNPPSQTKLSPLNFSKENLLEVYNNSLGKIDNIIFNNILGLSKQSATEISFRISNKYDAFKDDITGEIFVDGLINFYNNLHEIYKPNMVFDYDKTPVDFFPFEYSQYIDSNIVYTESLSAAMDSFYAKRDLRNKINQQSADLRKLINNLIARSENKLNQIEEILGDSKKAEEYKLYGELLTSSFHELKNAPKGSETVYLTNYYLEGMPKVAIPLNPTVSFSENAQNYFKKYRKHRTAMELAVGQKEDILRDMLFLEGNILDLDNCTTMAEIAEIKQSLIDANFIKKDKLKSKNKVSSQSKPLHFMSPDSIDVFVGKNSAQNERLTLKAKPNETWLHVQGMAGSHVIIKSEQQIPDNTLLFAAKLAAYFSKAKNSPTVNVDYTLKKHVKKAPGTPTGFVTYKNFKTLLVALSPEDIAYISNKS